MIYVINDDPIEILQLSVRTSNCLHRAGLHTVGAMLQFPKTNKWSILPNMGKKSIEEVEKTISILIGENIGNFCLVEYRDTLKEESEAEIEPDDSKMMLDDNGKIIKDIPITRLGLSVRAMTCLKNEGIVFASQLISKKREDLIQIPKLGAKTTDEILEIIENIDVRNAEDSVMSRISNECLLAFGKSESTWIREILSVKLKYPEVKGESLIYRLYETPFMQKALKNNIISIIEQNNDEISRNSLGNCMPMHLSNTTIIEELLLELELESKILLGEVMIYRLYPSAVEFINTLNDERNKQVVLERLKGTTLNEIGEKYGLTRERVRQVVQKCFSKKPKLKEDKYLEVFSKYDFSKEDFLLAYDEPEETYNYLEIVTPKRVKKSTEEILSDVGIPLELRKKAEKAIYKQYITIDGVRVKKERPEIVKHFVKANCKTLTKFEDFYDLYHIQLELLGLQDDPSLIIEPRTYENKLNLADYVLWNWGNSFRYYNIPERDYTELLDTLDLEQYENIEISTLKLFRDYPILMEQFDIRDEYELHNLLRKIWPCDNSLVHFKKMPTIEIGTADRNYQVLSLLLQYAPITADDLAQKYEEEFGVKAPTVRGSFFQEFGEYFYDGVYSIDYAGLPSVQKNHLIKILDKDFYTIQQVKTIYNKEFPNSDISLINPYTLNSLGFHAYPGYPGYIIRNTYMGATDYFRELLHKDDIVDMRDADKTMKCTSTYQSELSRCKHSYDIIEFLPEQYINLRRLEEGGFSKLDLKNYCKTIESIIEVGDYFTIKSLQEDGFYHELDDLGFDEWFYSSILVEDMAHFSYQRIGGTRLFLRGRYGAQFGDMLCWLLEKYQKIDFYDLIDLLENRFGIFIPKEKVKSAIKETELYYDSIMEAVYINYETYFEEI